MMSRSPKPDAAVKIVVKDVMDRGSDAEVRRVVTAGLGRDSATGSSVANILKIYRRTCISRLVPCLTPGWRCQAWEGYSVHCPLEF